jgi:hypothetical protein
MYKAQTCVHGSSFTTLPSSTLLSVAQYTCNALAVVHNEGKLQGITNLLEHPYQAPGRITHTTQLLCSLTLPSCSTKHH